MLYIESEVHSGWKFFAPIWNLEPSMNLTRESIRGISATRREDLTVLSRSFDEPFSAAQAAEALGLDLAKTRRLLAALAEGGWLARVRHGWYITVPLDASVPSEWREDPWIVATTLFAPCYIGGWSACEHWGLTDQIFGATYVVAARKVTPTDQTIQGSQFKIHSIQEDSFFGTRRVWRRRTAVEVSDPHRTIVDIMDAPSAAGGALHAAEILRAYFESEHVDEDKLIEYGDRLGRGALFKRLGFLIENERLASGGLVNRCRERVSKGISYLDPDGSDSGRIVSRWNLKVNVSRLAPLDQP